MKYVHELTVQMIPIDKIRVLNHRSRSKDKHRLIAASITHLGLKKPVTVARRTNKDGETYYELGCGEGRLETYRNEGQTEIPAFVVDTDREGLLLMSLAENLARRNRTTVELAREIVNMKERGYKASEIAQKTDLNVTYVNAMLRLMRCGEERLVVAVERGVLPFSVAVAIAESDDAGVQKAMADAYEKGQLKGKSLLRARRLVEQRNARGKRSHRTGPKQVPVTAETLMDAYKKDSSRQQALMHRFRLGDARLQFIVSALKKLLGNESFVNLLLAEKLTTVPKYLASRLQFPGVASDN